MKIGEEHEMKKYNIDRKLNWDADDGDSMQQQNMNTVYGEKSQLYMDNTWTDWVGQSAPIGSDRVYWGMCVSQGTTEGAGWTCDRNHEEK